MKCHHNIVPHICMSNILRLAVPEFKIAVEGGHTANKANLTLGPKKKKKKKKKHTHTHTGNGSEA